ncbi:HAMP domain-containing protein [Xylophilus rhododendri]|uniref:histidine kinase n=1 Tax=Xylophilus rhododendri TaxID=2697032 RepID=A0A857IYE9_9BURK|nr:sensor histidine kinase [Xylophilus rhododendri]QHI96574.1 HAMP domain-containing protein [Xylophilus rhododendri]
MNRPERRQVFRGLQRRLVLLLLLPLLLLALLSAWIDYRSADSAALQQDAQLLRMAPLLADSIIVPAAEHGDVLQHVPQVLLAPPVEEFLKERPGTAAWSMSDDVGRVLQGDGWLESAAPGTREPEFISREHEGVLYRIMSLRIVSPAGDFVMQLADGSDPRQDWGRAILVRALLPNLVLLVLAAVAMQLAVRHALKPLLDVKDAVERRSPRDLSPLDEGPTPDEVRPLVQSLNRLFGLVNAQSDSQRRFVADAAHQLRTPLAALQSQVEAWAHAADEHGVRLRAEDVWRMRDATRRTSQLAHQLLALSRADAHALDARAGAPVELLALCHAMIELHFPHAADRQVDLGLDCAPARVIGQEWLLREMLSNLVDNAVKYTPAGGTVTVRCRLEADEHGKSCAVLEVEDDGPGIANEERGRVLERFYRVRGTAGEGNGLGLAIAEEIARSHGSRLLLGEGTGGGG